MRVPFVLAAIASLVAFAAAPASVSASQVSGAIFTTDSDGSQVNQNNYAAREDVYLNGGPGLNAPPGAAGLPPGKYVFMVTSPSGKTLLSTDRAGCRVFTVGSVGYITAYSPTAACNTSGHLTGTGLDGSTTIQLMPYDETPNHGGVYKAWATPIGDFPAGCLSTVDCATGKHGFTPSDSKTDNFKVKVKTTGEFDVQFFDTAHNMTLLSGISVVWDDTVGASNLKWTDPSTLLEAHVEGPENGTHTVNIFNQAGCTITDAWLEPDGKHFIGPSAIAISVTSANSNTAWHINVNCN